MYAYLYEQHDGAYAICINFESNRPLSCTDVSSCASKVWIYICIFISAGAYVCMLAMLYFGANLF